MRKRGWFKLWGEKLMGSPRVRSLKPYDYGIYMHLLVASDDEGAMVSGTHVWTIEDVCREINAPKARRRVSKAIDRFLASGLLTVRGRDGAWLVSNYSQLQAPVEKRPKVRATAKGRPGKGPTSISSLIGA